MFVLGLTGSIGMGKSTVSGLFTSAGVPVWGADEAVHAMYAAGGAAVGPVGSLFEGVVKDGAIDRAALSKHVVGDEAAMKRLEEAVHPLVEAARREFLGAMAGRGEKLVVLDIPLLYETKGEGACDAVAVVSAGPSVQRERVLARPGMVAAKFEAILARQVPDEEKRRRGDFTIDTGCSIEETEGHVRALVDSLRGREGKAFSG